MKLTLEIKEAVHSPQKCDWCGKFVSMKDPAFYHIQHEYGDYGSILSSELLCTRCYGK